MIPLKKLIGLSDPPPPSAGADSGAHKDHQQLKEYKLISEDAHTRVYRAVNNTPPLPPCIVATELSVRYRLKLYQIAVQPTLVQRATYAFKVLTNKADIIAPSPIMAHLARVPHAWVPGTLVEHCRSVTALASDKKTWIPTPPLNNKYLPFKKRLQRALAVWSGNCIPFSWPAENEYYVNTVNKVI